MKRKKCTDAIALHLNETLKADIKELAAKAGHEKLSTFIRQVLREYAYGKRSPGRDLLAGTVSDD